MATHLQVGAPIIAVSPDLTYHEVIDAVFSPDSSLLATAGADGLVRLWDVALHRQVGAPITTVAAGQGPSSVGVGAVAFSPDGSVLATAEADGTARLWDVDA